MRNTDKTELAIETETATPTIGILSYLPFDGKQVQATSGCSNTDVYGPQHQTAP